MEAKKLTKKLSKSVKPVKPELVEEEMSQPADKILSREDQLALEDALNSSEKAKLRTHIAEQVLVNKKLEKELADRNVITAQNQVTVSDGEYKAKAKNAGDLIKSLATKYAVVGDFHYDPTSGKIG